MAGRPPKLNPDGTRANPPRKRPVNTEGEAFRRQQRDIDRHPRRIEHLDAQLEEKAKDIARKAVLRTATEDFPGLVDPPLDDVDKQALRKERAILERALQEERRELGKSDFWYFITNIVFPDVWKRHYAEGFQGVMAQLLQELEAGENLWFFVFREARKSYIADMLFNWWRIVRDPDIRILLVGAREETVKPFARLMIQPFIPGTPGFETFQSVYPDYVFREARGSHLRQAYQFTHPLRRKALADPTFRATYLGVSGAGWRCDSMTFDDPIERRKVSTPEQSSKAMRDMLDLIPLVDSGSPYRNVIGCGTPWVYHDPYARIMGLDVPGETNELADELLSRGRTRIFMRHALEHPSEPCTECPARVLEAFPHGRFDLAEGVPPDYPVHTREMILDRYEDYSKDPERGESLFFHQYGVIYRSPKNQKFQEHWFVTAPFPYWQLQKKRVLCIDAADKDFQKENTGDFMVALFGEFDDYGRLLLVHGLRSRAWTRAVFQNNILAWCKSTGWWPNVVAKEKFGEGGGSFLTDLGLKFWEHQQPVHVVPITRGEGTTEAGTLRKYDYITAALQGPFERAYIIFGSAFPPELRERAKQELLSLSQLRYDDVADTLALFLEKKVRLELSPSFAASQGTWQPPALGSYQTPLPGQPIAPPPFSPEGAALESLVNRGAFQALPDVGFSRRGEGPDQPPPGGFHIVIP